MTAHTLFHKCSLRLSLVVACLVCVGVMAQTDTDLTLSDIAGMKSAIALRDAQRAADRDKRKWAEEDAQRNARWSRRHRALMAQLGRASKHPVVTATARPGKTSRPILVSTLQNITLTFVNPRGNTVSNLPILATVHCAGKPNDVRSLKTDADGLVRLTGVGPLPASVDITPVSPSRDVPTEWQLTNVDDGSFLLASARGRHVATLTAGINQSDAGEGVAHRANSSEEGPIRVAMALPDGNLIGIIGRRKYKTIGRAHATPTQKRILIFEYKAQNPIVVERTVVDVDVAAPPGSQISVGGLDGQAFTTDLSGHAHLQIPSRLVATAPVPLRIGASLPGGEAECVVDQYGIDPYSTNQVTAPPLTLVRVSTCVTAHNIGVFSDQDAIDNVLGSAKRAHGSKNADGSEWREYQSAGFSVKMRRLPSGRNFAESVRLTSHSAGSVGGLSVDDPAGNVEQELGPPDSIAQGSGAEAGRAVASYLEGGLRICRDTSRITWIELDRPTSLLISGTTAFAPREPAKLYVASFQGNARTPLRSLADLEANLGRLPAIRLVSSRDDADLVLDAAVSDFSEQKEDLLIGALPFKYHCSTGLKYTLRDAHTGSLIVTDKETTCSAGVDYTGAALAGIVAAAVLAHQKSDLAKLLAIGIVAGGAAELQRTIQKAVNRCPAITTRSAFGTMASDIARAADFSARVTHVDYHGALVTVNVGTDDGIGVSTADHPAEFEISVSGTPLPESESGGSADYYTAVVVSADAHSSLCELRHVKRRVSGPREKVEDKLAFDMVKELPDPATGALSAAAVVRFPSLSVIPDSALVPDDKVDEALNQALVQRGDIPADNKTQAVAPGGNLPAGAQADPPPSQSNDSDPGAGLIGRIFGRKKSSR